MALIKFSALALSLMLAASCGGELRGNECMTSTVRCSEDNDNGGERIEAAASTAPDVEPYLDFLPDGKTLAELPEHDIALTAVENGVILRAGERQQAFDWLYMTPRAIMPNMMLRDWDGDGKNELAIILYIGSGTGVSVSDLRIIEIEEAGFKDTYFDPDDYVQQVLNVAGFSAFKENEELKGKLTLGDSAHIVSLKEYDENEIGKVMDKLVIGSISDFSFEADRIVASFGAGIAVEKFATPIYVGNIEADVAYESGTYQLADFRFVPNPEQE
ncbi:hypothetical protein D3P09_18285 [Paenibacillus pinisoli]|uniref:VCBS repeat-containing protein n=1 Tax=Paenibacillus pinisoli TaxID=1276110 RepID=A0A3A6PEG6_9BACL|nr:hypothetical protein [Paenibacillus pinisoli]RJX38026.1 hypothetical protein D3P09_18285 [Paenibacillus pinisoli]